VASPLLYSLSEFRELLFACLEAAEARTIVEIGSEEGEATRALAEFVADRGGEVWCVEPEPTMEVERLDRERENFHLVVGRSPSALEGIGPCDAWIIDGDHNYWTVARELEHGDATARDAGRPALILLHDVAWPCARRDQYYAPDALPDEAVHPHSYDLGRVRDNDEAVRGGFRGGGSYAIALHAGGPRNGVLTAVEDFLEGRADLRYAHVPVIFGLGVIYSAEAPYAAALADLLRSFDGSDLLDRIERNRTDLYLRVLELQDTISDLSLRQSRLLAEYDTSLAAAEAEAAALRLELARLREEARTASPSS
jgi:hypothetical protein